MPRNLSEIDNMKSLSKQNQLCNKRNTISTNRNSYKLSIQVRDTIISVLSKNRRGRLKRFDVTIYDIYLVVPKWKRVFLITKIVSEYD